MEILGITKRHRNQNRIEEFGRNTRFLKELLMHLGEKAKDLDLQDPAMGGRERDDMGRRSVDAKFSNFVVLYFCVRASDR